MAGNGFLEKLMRTQDRMYKQVVQIKKKMKNTFNLGGKE